MPLDVLKITLKNINLPASAKFGGPQSKLTKLPVPYEQQLLSNWCWAACATMAAKNTKTQCDLGRVVFPTATCPPAQVSNGQADPNEIDRVLREAGRSPSASNSAPPAQTADLLNELSAGRPVQIGWQWDFSQGGHVVLLVGSDQIAAQTVFFIHDPLPSNEGGGPYIQMTSSDLSTAGGRGRWIYVWMLH